MSICATVSLSLALRITSDGELVDISLAGFPPQKDYVRFVGASASSTRGIACRIVLSRPETAHFRRLVHGARPNTDDLAGLAKGLADGLKASSELELCLAGKLLFRFITAVLRM